MVFITLFIVTPPPHTHTHVQPEWYFTQVSAWIRDHTHFLETEVQPLLHRESGFSHVDIRVREETVGTNYHETGPNLSFQLTKKTTQKLILVTKIPTYTVFPPPHPHTPAGVHSWSPPRSGVQAPPRHARYSLR